MQQLTGLDAGFLYVETPTLHMHTLKVAVLDFSDVPGGYRFENVRKVLAANLHRLPPFRRKRIEIPWNLGHPIWVEDPDFDIDAHLSRRTVAGENSGEGLADLCAVVSDVASSKLNPDRPLWEIVVVEGLGDGRIGIVGKIHHSVADGTASFEMLSNFIGAGDAASSLEPGATSWQPDSIPSRSALVVMAIVAAWRRLLKIPSLIKDTVLGVAHLIQNARSGEATDPRHPSTPFHTPTTSFNAALSARRVFATCALDLADLKQIKDALGVSLNDVYMAVCSGALRRYLAARGEAVPISLIASVPTNTHPEEIGRLSGNHLGNLMATLATDLADPIERVRVIHGAMEKAKRNQQALGRDILEDWNEFSLRFPYSAIVRWWSRSRMADRVRPPINLVVSNVRGPAKELSITGVRLMSIHTVGPILEGIGLNMTACSYADALHVSILACPDHGSDPWKLAACIPEAVDELLAAVRHP
jgi:diacylglycerol O-acyltransferase